MAKKKGFLDSGPRRNLVSGPRFRGDTQASRNARTRLNTPRRQALLNELETFTVLGNTNFRDFKGNSPESGSSFISQRTHDDILNLVDNIDIFDTRAPRLFASLLSNLAGVKEGNDPIFKSRVATEQRFLLAKDQPGRRQTKNIGTQAQLGAISAPINNNKSIAGFSTVARPRLLK